MKHTCIIALLALATGCLSAYPPGSRLPIPELVKTSGFRLKPTTLPSDKQVVIFYYSASWCAPCKQMSEILKEVYGDIVGSTEGLEFVTYSVDHSPRSRADYLRETEFEWPAISPQVIDDEPWLIQVPGGTPDFQAFRIEDDSLIAITEKTHISAVLAEVFSKSSKEK